MLPYASGFRVVSLLCAALAITAAAPALGRVGVTSQTDGDPLGKPPTQNERVLRVGIDIQANEVITTKSDDRAHIVFLDGTALTVAPNAQLVIDRFVYDPAARTGDLSVTVSAGVLRLVGGKISKKGRMTINTPAATLGIRGGIGLFVVSAAETRAHFLFGISLTVTAGGWTETATRPGSLIVTRAGAMPSPPIIPPNSAITEALRALEGTDASADRSADDAAKRSGFSALNSDRGVDGLGGGAPRVNGEGQQALGDAATQRTFGSTQSGASAPFFAGSTGSMGSLSGGTTGGGSVGGTPGSIGGTPGSVGGIPGSIGGPPGSTGGRSGPPFPATPAIGVGNGGLVHAVPGGPRR